MVRIARVVAEGLPHHIIQRGNRKQNVFFQAGDKQAYLDILYLQCQLFHVEVWAYCLMDNHIHLIVVPKEENSLTLVISETHKLYTRMINFREGWRGYLWQGRFKSTVLDERYLYAAVRYVERNPVRARMVEKAEEYLWSSARFHVKKEKSKVLSRCYLEDEINDWAQYLLDEDDEEDMKIIRAGSETGRPVGSEEFIKGLEVRLGRSLLKRRPGPRGK